MLDVLDNFKIALIEFAAKHRDRINKDPEFRMHFNSMCNSAGVDPLASSKGFWANILGVGDFYYELGVVVIHICMKRRPQNGGIIFFSELVSLVQAYPTFNDKVSISDEDIRRAVEKIQTLGHGFRIITRSSVKLLVSIPLELNKDHEELLDIAASTQQGLGDYVGTFVTEEAMILRGWAEARFQIIIMGLLREGIAWIDDYEGQVRYYFPCLIKFN